MSPEDWKMARFISEDESTVQCLILVKAGVPFDVAFSLSEVQRFAYVVVLKQMDSNVYLDWDVKRWKEKPQGKSWGRM